MMLPTVRKAVASTGVLLLLLPAPALAGGGHVTKKGGVDRITMNLQFRFPPTQDEIDRVREQIQRASTLICDATEGQMRIGKARLLVGNASEDDGDVWYYPPGGVTRSSSNGGPLHDASRRIFLNYYNIRSDVLTHEMGHQVFGLSDQYDEQRRKGGACGIGPSHDEGTIDEWNHSIMQQTGAQRCVTAAYEVTLRSCFDADDCEPGETCPLPFDMSEFNVEQNFDQLIGDDSLPADSCPANRAGDTFTIRGRLPSNANFTPFDPTDHGTAAGSAWRETAEDYIDEIGDVPAYGEGSAHPIWVYPEHVNLHAWTLHFGIDGGQFDPEDEGTLILLESVDVEFSSTPTGSGYVPGEGSFDEFDLIQVDGASPGVNVPVLQLDAFANGGAATTLDVTFEDFKEREFDHGTTSIRASWIHAGGAQQLGVCTKDPACEKFWNSATQRWEATDVTRRALQKDDPQAPEADWTTLLHRVDSWYGIDDWEAPEGVPVWAAPAWCDDPVEFEVKVSGVDQVMLVLDRSGSMDTEREYVGETRTRLDWAKAGARGFVGLQKGSGVDVGLISFSGEKEEADQSPWIVLDKPLKPIEGAESPTEHGVDAFRDYVTDELSAGGDTAIGDALERARQVFADEPDETVKQAIFFLSDGEKTAGIEIPPVLEALKDDGIVVYTMPLADATEDETLGQVADATGGEMLDAEDPDELPTLYAELYARFRGEQPVINRTALDAQPGAPGVFGPPATIEIPVEPGAERLNLMLSARHEQPGPWEPWFQLRDPDGAVVETIVSPGTTNDPYFHVIRRDAPAAGVWVFELMSTNTSMHTAWFLAHVENPGPDCWADVDAKVADGSAGVVVSAAASLDEPLGRGVSYVASVQRPDGSVVDVTLEPTEHGVGAEGLFTDFVGRGRYDVVVACDVGGGARYTPGERATLEDVLGQDRPDPFRREPRTSFFLDVATPAPTEPGGDCDDDGIPDAVEGTQDTDQDGLPDHCDSDSDNDDVPDEDEGTGDPDGDGLPGSQDPDSDDDGEGDATDDCPQHYDPMQSDADGDGQGDVCDGDDDGDGVPDDGDGSGDPDDNPCGTGSVPGAPCDDNCRTTPNSSQSNSDGDPRGDACDCDPFDPQSWSAPGAARGLRLQPDPASGQTLLSWQPPEQPGATAIWYDVIRSGSAQDFLAGSGVCLAGDTTGAQAWDPGPDPLPGEAAFFLVRTENPCGTGNDGNAGADSSGAPRRAVACTGPQ